MELRRARGVSYSGLGRPILSLTFLLRIASVVPQFKEQCDSTTITFHNLLKDGIILAEYVHKPIMAVVLEKSSVLCPQISPIRHLFALIRLINKLAETNLVKISTMNLPFKQMVRLLECL
jgi:hypothetical protein